MPSTVIGKPTYNLGSFESCQKSIDAAVLNGITSDKLEAFLYNFYVEQSKIINPELIQDVSLSTLEEKILRPRQDLYLIILNNWIKHIFIPLLGAKLADSVFIFGVGRIFSAYSNMGVQYCTDADLNVVVLDSVTPANLAKLSLEVKKMQAKIWELFNIIVEFDPFFTVLRAGEIKARLAHKDTDKRLAATLFYKGNAASLFVLYDNPVLREDIFGRVGQLPDALLFENFLGGNPVKPTFSRLRDESVKLSIVDDATKKSVAVDALIGTKKFARNCRYLSAVHPELYPQHWWFSMKYSVNRVYDYVSAMLHGGYRLCDLGFSGEADPDYQFLYLAHKLMLFLQELIHIQLDSFSGLCDYSYISAERFTEFMSLPKGSFRSDFDGIVLSGNFLYDSQRNQYLNFKKAVRAKKELHLYLEREQVSELSGLFGFTFYHLDKGSGKNTVTVPYTWGGLGFFVFSAVENRLSNIVDIKLVPALNRR